LMDEKSRISSFLLQSFLLNFSPALSSLLHSVQYVVKHSCSGSPQRSVNLL
jgi:hypothetical protein